MSETNEVKKKILKRKMDAQDWLRIAGIFVFLGVVVLVTIVYARTFGEVTAGSHSGNLLENLLASGLNLKEYIIANHPTTGFFVLLLLQFLQVIITAVPAVITSFAGGMIYGVWGGMAISILGSFAGTVLTFYLTRLLGRRMLTLFVSEKNIAKIEKLIDADTGVLVLFVLFVIPSPKDFYAFFVGLTNMKAWKFFLISTIGRLPGMFAAVFMGAMLENENWPLLIGITVFGAIVCVLFVVFNKRILAILKKEKNIPQEEASV